MDDKKTNMTFDDAEKDFKKKVFDIFSEKHSGIYRDKDGLIVVPVAKKKSSTTQTVIKIKNEYA